MKCLARLSLVALAALRIATAFAVEDSPELRAQRQEAHKARLEQRSQRNAENQEAVRAFREHSRELQQTYAEQLSGLETEFALQRSELQAEHRSRLAEAEAERQAKLMALYTGAGGDAEGAAKRAQEEMRAMQDERFQLEKQAAEEHHQASMAHLERKNALLAERDAEALERAEELGLTDERAPILAEPIGGALTAQEEQWNERERREVERLNEQNQRMVEEIKKGETMRQWERANREEDFQLEWDEKGELREIETNSGYQDLILGNNDEIDQQEMMAMLTELEKQKKLVRIKYDKLREQNRIRRDAERNKIRR